MDPVRIRIQRALTALGALEEALEIERPSKLERDGAIQRFEFSFEAFWKAAQAWLEHEEGVRCGTPRSCIRALGEVGALDMGETMAFLAMTDDRNLTVHTYQEETARAIFARLPSHAALLRRALERMETRRSNPADTP
jgi:nucleotidyltransferase substrate binding protein (TIGR01987 family)